ncbi:MAG: CdaR family protein [Anaerolineales bacterium]
MIKADVFKWLFRNLSMLGIALVLAIAVWISAVTGADPDEVRPYPRAVPLEIVGQDPGLIIISTLPDSINLTLRAPHSVWDKLSATDNAVRAVLDLAGLSAGEHNLEVQVQVRVGPVRVISVSPQTVSINLQSLSTQAFPINLSIRGEVAVGFQAGTPEIGATQVMLSGPAALIAQVKHVQADLSIAGLRQDVQTSLPLRALDENGTNITGLTLNPENVQVHLPITQQGGYRDIAVKVVVHGQVAGGYRLTNISVFPPILTVYSREPLLVNELPGYVETEPLNLDGSSEGTDTHLGLKLPEGISVVGDQTVQVQVGIAAIEGSLSLNNMKVEVIGLADGLDALVSPETVDVILTGPLPLLDKLSAGDVKIVVDLTGLRAGTHQLTAQAKIIINDVQVQSINPATIEVTLSLNGKPTVTPTVTPAAIPD